MSYKAVDWALSVGGKLTPAERLLLVALAKHHNPQYGCFPSQRVLVPLLGLRSRRQLARLLVNLVRMGLVSVKSKGRGNRYILHTEMGHARLVSSSHMGHPRHMSMGHTRHMSGSETERHVTPVSHCSNTVSKTKRIGNGKAAYAASTQTEQEEKSHFEKIQNHSGNVLEDAKGLSEEDKAIMRKMTGNVEEIVCQTTEVPSATEIHALIQKKADAREGIPPPNAIWTAWRDFTALYHRGAFTGPPGVQQLSQLKKAYAGSGNEMITAMETCIRDWEWFVKAVKDSGEYVKGSIPHPHIGFFLRNLTIAINFARRERGATPDPTAEVVDSSGPKPLTNAVVSVQTDRPSKASLETAMKILGGK